MYATSLAGMRRALRICLLLPAMAGGMGCMSAPMSERIRLYSAESPATGPAGVPGSGGTGAAGSFGSGGTMGGTTLEGAQVAPGNETQPPKNAPEPAVGPLR
jgi:hypothetical protein